MPQDKCKENKHEKAIVTLVLTILFAGGIISGASNPRSSGNSNIKINMMDDQKSSAKYELKIAVRKLWEDHVMWTRNVIFCLADELPGTDQAVKRLLQNQDDIGNAIKPFYGEEAGKKLTELLYAHIKISADVVKSAKAGNNAALMKPTKNGMQTLMKFQNS